MAKEAVHKESTTQVKTVEADEFATLLKQSFKPRTLNAQRPKSKTRYPRSFKRR
ncbi:hypothetical protein ABIF39_004592 [Bradyrhizobium diazoefficiens]